MTDESLPEQQAQQLSEITNSIIAASYTPGAGNIW